MLRLIFSFSTLALIIFPFITLFYLIFPTKLTPITKRPFSRRAIVTLGTLLIIGSFSLTTWSEQQIPPDNLVINTELQSASPTPSSQFIASVSPSSPQLTPSVSTAESNNNNTAVITEIIDGDTARLNTGETLRYIGIDTPETKHPTKGVECFGQQAAAKNRELVVGKAVILEKDVSDTDRYGRLLRYVYIDGVMLNELLVREGFARASTYPPDVKYQKRFQQAQQEAQANNRGLWSSACPSVISDNNPNPASPNTQIDINAAVPKCKYDCHGPDKDCQDFSSSADAQAFFNCCGFSATFDPMRLDNAKGEGNGLACENLN